MLHSILYYRTKQHIPTTNINQMKIIIITVRSGWNNV